MGRVRFQVLRNAAWISFVWPHSSVIPMKVETRQTNGARRMKTISGCQSFLAANHRSTDTGSVGANSSYLELMSPHQFPISNFQFPILNFQCPRKRCAQKHTPVSDKVSTSPSPLPAFPVRRAGLTLSASLVPQPEPLAVVARPLLRKGARVAVAVLRQGRFPERPNRVERRILAVRC